MLVYPQGSDTPLRGDLIVRTILRTDLTPVPATFEIETRNTRETLAALVEGAVLRVGAELHEFKLIKVTQAPATGFVQGSRQVSNIQAIGILLSCAPLAEPLQRSVYSENASLGQIYRACGAQVRIDSDFNVPVFACYFGMVPTMQIAQVLQEEAGALIYAGGKITFRRLTELRDSAAQQRVTRDKLDGITSEFLRRHSVPFLISTDAAGEMVVGRREAALGVAYRPRGDQRIVNNMSTALILRGKLRNILSLNVNAGARIDVDSTPHIAITAAHVEESGTDGEGAEQYSQYWLGEVVTP